MLEIPARFHFEDTLYRRRSQGAELSAAELSALMASSRERYYGPGMGVNGARQWQTVRHFYLTADDRQFYNYPYLVGFGFAVHWFLRSTAQRNTSSFACAWVARAD